MISIDEVIDLAVRLGSRVHQAETRIQELEVELKSYKELVSPLSNKPGSKHVLPQSGLLQDTPTIPIEDKHRG